MEHKKVPDPSELEEARKTIVCGVLNMVAEGRCCSRDDVIKGLCAAGFDIASVSPDGMELCMPGEPECSVKLTGYLFSEQFYVNNDESRTVPLHQSRNAPPSWKQEHVPGREADVFVLTGMLLLISGLLIFCAMEWIFDFIPADSSQGLRLISIWNAAMYIIPVVMGVTGIVTMFLAPVLILVMKLGDWIFGHVIKQRVR